jgi:hypothetical protein
VHFELNETYTKVLVSKQLSDSFPIQNGLKKGDAFQFCFRIQNAQENQVGLKSDGTHQLLAYADDVNLLAGNIDTAEQKHKF